MSPSRLISIFELDIYSFVYILMFSRVNYFLKVKTTNPKKYCVRPNTGVVHPRSSSEVLGLSLFLFVIDLQWIKDEEFTSFGIMVLIFCFVF